MMKMILTQVPGTKIFYGDAPLLTEKNLGEELAKRKIKTLFLAINLFDDLPRVKGCRIVTFNPLSSQAQKAISITKIIGYASSLKTGFAITCSDAAYRSPAIAIACAMAQGIKEEQIRAGLKNLPEQARPASIEWAIQNARKYFESYQQQKREQTKQRLRGKAFIFSSAKKQPRKRKRRM